jgi:spermidine synthase
MNRRPCLIAGLATLVALFVLACAAQTVIYEKVSLHGAIIVTEGSGGLRTLYFSPGGARQSVVKPGDPDHLELPYARTALAGLALCEDPRRILVVGLGGGTLPSFLRKHYPNVRIDVVDIDPEVVEVAKKFFGFREDPGMQAHVDDGRRFIENIREPVYDVIFLDAFGTDSVPAHLTTHEFLRAVRRAVMPDGVVVGNVWSRSSNPLYDSMVRTYQEAFDELFILDVPGGANKILLALPRNQPLTQSELAQLARRVSAAGQYRFDLGDLVNYGFLRAHQKNQQGRLLED